jgi:adenylate cyclase
MNFVSKLFRSSIAMSLLIGTVVFLCLIGLRSIGSLESLELTAYDWYVGLQPEVPVLDPDIVLIEIGENDIQNLTGWPLTDDTVARMLKTLLQYHPCAIGLDIYRDIPVPPGAKELETVLANNRNIIVSMKFAGDEKVGIPPPQALKGTEQVGFNDIVVDSGGIVRRGLLFLDDGKTVFYSFALRLALLYLRGKGGMPQSDAANLQHLRLGKTTIKPFGPNDGGYVQADDRGYQFLLNFRKARTPFPSFSLTSLLSSQLDPLAIQGKIVLIGTKSEAVKDFFFTPFSRGLHSNQQVSGVALHARIVSELLSFPLQRSSPISTLSDWQEWVWIFLWSLAGGIIGMVIRSPWRFSLFSLAGLFFLALIAYSAFQQGWWIPLIPPAITWCVSAAVVTAYMSNVGKTERASLMQLFSRHVSKEVAQLLWKERDLFLEGGRPRSRKLTATVLFTDLQDFTAVSEKMDPQSLIDWLNTYLEAMAKLVMEHGGIVDDYAGDGLKADFGVPFPRETEAEISQDVVNAVNCALAMEQEIKRLNATWQERNLPTVNMRIGIFTGPVVAGSLGSTQRLKYTTIGDTVNIASRLEQLSKDLVGFGFTDRHCRILIGESTLRYLSNQFKSEKVGEVSLKGKLEKITVHCLIGRVDKSSRDTCQEEAS